MSTHEAGGLQAMIDKYFPKDKRHARGQAMLMKEAIVAREQSIKEQAEREGMHAGVELAEKNIVSVISAYRDEKHKTELRNAKKSLKLSIEQLHESIDQGVSLNLTPHSTNNSLEEK